MILSMFFLKFLYEKQPSEFPLSDGCFSFYCIHACIMRSSSEQLMSPGCYRIGKPGYGI